MAGTSEAVIGLVGVLVGGAITTVGTLYAQRLQASASRAADVRAREIAASSTAITVISQLIQMPDQPAASSASDEWQNRRQDLLLAFGTVSQDLRPQDLRVRMDEVHHILEMHAAATSLTGDPERHIRSVACGHALASLGAFRRGEPLPARPAPYTAALGAIEEWTSRHSR